jgi:hypothetical protein
MADTKISQLTAASTPLAGTEVLPIVQSGSTVKVSAANVTAGRDTSFKTGLSTPRNGAIPTTSSVLTGLSVFNDQDNVTADGVAVFLDHSYRTPGSQARGVKLFSYSEDFFSYKVSAKLQVTKLGALADSVYFKETGDVQISDGNLEIGTANKSVKFSGNGGVLWRCGAGTPEGAVTAPVGSLFTRTDGGLLSTLYVKESGTGNTGWVGK